MTRRDPDKRVARRRVFYFPGFDPRTLRKYTHLLRSEGASHAARTGARFTMARPRRVAPHIQRCELQMALSGHTVVTDYDFLLWRDLVSARMKAPLPKVFRLLASDLWHYLRTGTFHRVLQAEWRMFLCFIYPYWMSLAFLLGAGLCVWLAFSLAASAGLPWLLAAAGGLLLALAFLAATRRTDGIHFVYWLAHYYRFSRDAAAGRTPLLRTRREGFAAEILAARASGAYDEILIVGHSAGALQAILALDACRARLAAAGTTPIALITIGQNISLVTLQPEAAPARRAVARQAQDRDIFWLDVSSQMDWMSFPRRDPARTADMPALPPAAGPLVTGAQFSRIFPPQKLRWARGRIMRLHFLFFHANARSGQWDWFTTICGPEPLSQRYAHPPARSDAP